MKNQYVGDAGDHGKYGLLRYLQDQEIRLAVNWYLTEDDGSNDGRHISYLQNSKEREKDPLLFDILKYLVNQNKRDVCWIEESKILGDTVFYHEILNLSGCTTAVEKRQMRQNWHLAALTACDGRDLVFLDPDNGIKEDTTRGLSDSVKYAFTSEAADYYRRGQSVVYYCSKARRTEQQWSEYKHLMRKYLPDAGLLALTFHGGTQRTYVFLIQPHQYEMYNGLLEGFLESGWKSGKNRFTKEII